jgi:hypothetical protein
VVALIVELRYSPTNLSSRPLEVWEGHRVRPTLVRHNTEKVRPMSYMTFVQYTGDTSNFDADVALARRKYKALGASRMTGSVALTGERAGSFVVASIWDTADGFFDARPQLLGDAEIVAVMQARGMAPVQTSFTEVYGETGTPDGTFAVSVVVVVETPTPEALQSLVSAASDVMLAKGVNGMRFTRAIAAGQQSGIHIAIAYVDSLDSYLAASAAAAMDSSFVAAMGNANAQIVQRQFNRMM